MSNSRIYNSPKEGIEISREVEGGGGGGGESMTPKKIKEG